MKLVLFQTSESDPPLPGVLTERGVVSIAGSVESGHTPQYTMQRLIDAFDELRPALERQASESEALPARCGCGRHCRGPARSSVALPITGSMHSGSPGRSICS